MSPIIRLSEVYLSVQGEGPRVGSRTVFVRTGGCNLKCPGWPCDTPHAINPVYRNEWKETSPQEVVSQIHKADPAGTANICFTGGEPFLQQRQALYDVVKLLSDLEEGPRTSYEVFTNGTLRFPDWAIDELYFVMDWKLPGSGEKLSEAFETTRWENACRIGQYEANAIKFTIADREDYDRAVEVYQKLVLKADCKADICYGAVWDKVDPKDLIEWVLEDGWDWKYNHQIHNVIWDRNKRGI